MRQNQQVALLVAVSFAVYAVHRLRFVGDCDSFAYFAQAEIFLGRDPGLYRFADPLRHAALTPLGMDVARGHFVSAFPPGYSLLLAAAGLIGGQYWVNPVLGALSVGLVYAAVARHAPHAIAMGAAALWAVCPLVAMNATDVMSDMAATTAVLGSYVLLRRGRLREAGSMAGLSLMIRPMNVLFLPCAGLLVSRRRRSLASFSVAFAAGAALSALAHESVWGALLSPTYHDNAGHFLPKYFPEQFPAYVRETVFHLGPILALASYRVARAPRESLPEIVWFGAFVLVHPFAGPVDIDWSRQRFLMPAYPAAFVLAARGAADLLAVVQNRSERLLRAGVRAALTALLAWGIFSVVRSVRLGALRIHPDRDVDCDAIAERLPRNALVGALEYSGALRLYAGLETFVWLHPRGISFARAEFARGRPLYLVLESDESLPDWDRAIERRYAVSFDLEPEFRLHAPGYVLYRVNGVREPGHRRIALTDPLVRWAVLDGWQSPDEHGVLGARAARCDVARLELILEPGVRHDLSIVAAAPEKGTSQSVEPWIRGRSLGRGLLGPTLESVTFAIPAELSVGTVPLELHFPGAPSCPGDGRAVARVESVETRVIRD